MAKHTRPAGEAQAGAGAPPPAQGAAGSADTAAAADAADEDGDGAGEAPPIAEPPAQDGAPQDAGDAAPGAAAPDLRGLGPVRPADSAALSMLKHLDAAQAQLLALRERGQIHGALAEIIEHLIAAQIEGGLVAFGSQQSAAPDAGEPS